jgi:hypothetical protein
MIADAGNTIHAILLECVKAGPQRCALARDNVTATEFEARIQQFIESLKSIQIQV